MCIDILMDGYRAELIHRIPQGERVLVFVQFADLGLTREGDNSSLAPINRDIDIDIDIQVCREIYIYIYIDIDIDI